MTQVFKFAFAALLLFTGVSAQAETATWTPQEIRISYSSFRSYYACSFAEDRLETYLKQMGARNVRVRCSGGLPHDSFLSLRASFTAARSSTSGERASWQQVTLTSRDSCDFNEKLMSGIIRSGAFETRNLRTRSSCWDSSGRVGYEFLVLK